MAHTTTLGDYVFIHNSGLEGTVLIRHKDSTLAIEIPWHELMGFVLYRIRDERVGKLENMDANELKDHLIQNL